MTRYRLGKPQVRRLINGQDVQDGRGRRYAASDEVKKALKEIDDSGAYDRIDIFMRDGGIELVERACQPAKAVAKP